MIKIQYRSKGYLNNINEIIILKLGKGSGWHLSSVTVYVFCWNCGDANWNIK